MKGRQISNNMVPREFKFAYAFSISKLFAALKLTGH